MLTCRFGSREDKSRCAATVDLVVTCVDVDAVHGEGLQIRYLHELAVNRVLGERVLSLLQLRVGDVAFQSCDVPARTLRQCTIGHSEKVATFSVRRSKGHKNKRYKGQTEES